MRLPVIVVVFTTERIYNWVLFPEAAPKCKKKNRKSSLSKASDEIPSLSTQRMKDMFWK